MMRLADYFVVFIAVAVCAASAFFVYGGAAEESTVLIEAQGESWEYPISANEEIHVKGVLGDTVIEIKDKKTHIISSPCQNKLCIAAGHISKAGEFLACLPNRVIVTIKGKKGAANGLDAVTW